MITKSAPTSATDYISRFPASTRQLLEELRATIKVTAAAAEEVISYQMPAYKWNGILVYFAGYQHHIGFYPGASAIAHFKEEISGYKNAKGSVQFPLDQPLPLDLVVRMVHFRLNENKEKAALKANKKKK